MNKILISMLVITMSTSCYGAIFDSILGTLYKKVDNIKEQNNTTHLEVSAIREAQVTLETKVDVQSKIITNLELKLNAAITALNDITVGVNNSNKEIHTLTAGGNISQSINNTGLMRLVVSNFGKIAIGLIAIISIALGAFVTLLYKYAGISAEKDYIETWKNNLEVGNKEKKEYINKLKSKIGEIV